MLAGLRPAVWTCPFTAGPSPRDGTPCPRGAQDTSGSGLQGRDTRPAGRRAGGAGAVPPARVWWNRGENRVFGFGVLLTLHDTCGIEK